MKINVVGNSISSLVFLDRISTKYRVTWYLEYPDLNGIFAGIKLKEVIYDQAFMNLELDLQSHYKINSKQKYSQYSINCSQYFLKEVNNYFKEYSQIIETPTIRMFTDRGLLEDFLLSNNITDLYKFKEMRQSDIVMPPKEIHPKFKLSKHSESKLMRIPYFNYLRDYYGENFYNVIANIWIKKLTDSDVSHLPTILHRQILAPLFYPETIKAGLNRTVTLNPTKFFYPAEGSLSSLMNSIFVNLKKRKNVELKNIRDIKYEDLNSPKTKFYWGSSVKNFMNIVGKTANNLLEPKGTMIDIISFLANHESKFSYSLLNLQNNEDSWYRITKNFNININDNTIYSLERKSTLLKVNYKDLFSQLNLRDIWFLRKITIPYFRLVNQVEFYNYMKRHQELLDIYRGVHFFGNSSFFIAKTLNDQIFQGLLASKEFD